MSQSVPPPVPAPVPDWLASTPEWPGAWFAGPLDPADVGEPTPPVTGPDRVLDGYAQSCFEGVYPACDGLFFESPPMSDYEEYGATCGGRIEPYAVGSCTDLD